MFGLKEGVSQKGENFYERKNLFNLETLSIV